MAGRTAAVIVAAAVGATAVTGCDSGSSSAQPGAQPPGGRVPAGTGYSSDQLEQALLTEIAGYRRAAEPESGEYATLRAVQNLNQLQRQVKLDKPQCAGATRTIDTSAEVDSAPAAIATFAKGFGQYATEALMTVPDATAEQLVKLRVPASCRSFRTRVGGKWSAHQIVEATHGRLGQGSRTVGVSTVTGSSRVKTWYVVLRSRGYVATVTLYGPNATRSEAEELARKVYERAERVLP
ncbi:MAG TPA: hypothetical protein VH912_14625 [Streptosporangiaceae bacterium]